IWALAAAGPAIAATGVQLARWLRVAVYIAMGWIAGAAIGHIEPALPAGATAALVTGGLLYTIGAVLYALRWPDPWPLVFGYHEIFHVLTIVAAAVFYTLIVAYVVPAPRP
nr:hemolysin III family protein [Gemmatimonadota bacterium]